MKFPRKISLVLSVLFLLTNTALNGQNSANEPTDTINMEQVVVTATRTDSRVANIPMRIHTLTSASLSTMPALSADEALKYTPGMNINRSFGVLSSKATVTMRGLSSKEQGRVLVLMDGIPLNKSDGGSVDWNMIDPYSIERIEITKGAGSAIYGGSAMGGIINIITQKPVSKFSLNASLDYGTYNTAGAKVNVAGRLSNSFYYAVNTFFRQSDGYITQPDSEIRENPYIIKSTMQEAGINVRTGIKLKGNNNLEVILKYYNDQRGTGEKVHQTYGNTTDHDSWGAILNYTGSLGTLKIKSSAYSLTEDYKKVNEYRKDDYTWYNVLSTRSDYGWLNSVTFSKGKNLITSGIDFKLGGVDGEDVYITSTDVVYNLGKMFTYAIFLQDELTLTDKIRLIAGIRYDNATFFDGAFYITQPTNETYFMREYQVPDMGRKNWNAISPRLSLQYRVNENTRIYGMVSRGFRPSELEYLCRSGRIKGGFKIASPDLKPEYLTNFEAGIDFVPVNDLAVNVSAYYSIGKDFQYYVSNGQVIDMGFGDRPIFIRDNIARVTISGVEGEFKYQLFSGLQITGGYAWAQSKILEYHAAQDTINLTGKFFTDVPEHMASIGARYINRYVNASFYYKYTGSMFINDRNMVDEILGTQKYPAYSTIDIKLWKDIKRFRISLGVQNLLDVDFYDSKYNVGPGRNIYGGIEFRLVKN